jgi:hypothetical protein
VCEGRPRELKAWVSSGGRKLWRGKNPGRDRRSGCREACLPVLRRRTDSPREQGPEDGLVSMSPAFGWGTDARGNGMRARAPKGKPIAVEGNPLEGEAHGRSSVLVTLAGVWRRKVSGAARHRGLRRAGGNQTPHAARGGEGIRRHNKRAITLTCAVGRLKSMRGSMRRSLERRPSGCRTDRWPCGFVGVTSEGARNAHGGPRVGFGWLDGC